MLTNLLEYVLVLALWNFTIFDLFTWSENNTYIKHCYNTFKKKFFKRHILNGNAQVYILSSEMNKQMLLLL